MADVTAADEDAFLDSLVEFAVQQLRPSCGLPERAASDAATTDDGGESTVSSSPTRTPSPSPEPSPGPSMSEQELARQEKARVKYRRIYHMRQARRQTLRGQVAALEGELATLSGRQTRAEEASTAAPPLLPAQLDALLDKRPTNRRECEQSVCGLSTLQLQLKRENAAHRRRLREFAARADRMRDELFAEHRLWVANATTFTMLKRLTVPESLAIRSRATDTVSAVLASTESLPSAGVVCGWKETRSVQRGLIRFVLQKTFYRFSAEEVANRMFAIVSDPREIAKLYKASMDVAFHFVQRVSDDCVMLLMEMTSLPGVDAKVTTIPLVSRRKVGSGFQILIQPLVTDGFPMHNDTPTDSASVGSPPSDGGGLNDHCFGIMLEAAGPTGGDCLCSFIGVAQAVQSHTYFWLVQELLHCLRAEELMFGPRFSLPRSPVAARAGVSSR